MSEIDILQDTPFPKTDENFEELLKGSFGSDERLQGRVVTGAVLSVENDLVLVDVGLKSEGYIPIKEFSDSSGNVEVTSGDQVEIFVERFEGRDGVVVLSREKARREEAWGVMEKALESEERVTGVIFGRVKGGFTVDLTGAVAFLPGSQVDVRPIRDISPLMGVPQEFQILKMDRARGNIVVSRRAVLEETRAEERSELMTNMSEGQVLEGVVKNITDYGAFVDLGGVDGLLHVTDIAWKRINHPTEVLHVGQTVSIQVIRFNTENQRISLGMKQLQPDPWGNVLDKFPIDAKLVGRVTNITDYGAFVELAAGVEGLVHVSEMSWTKKNVHPGKIVSTSQEVEVMVLDVDLSKRRISLGLKQCISNPWTEFTDKFKAGDKVEGEIKNITEFGLFVGLTEEIDGMVHLSDLDWVKPGEDVIDDYKKGDTLKVKILEVDLQKERISLGVKQLIDDPVTGSLNKIKKGDVVTCTITKVVDNGIEVNIMGDLPGFIRRNDLSRDRSEQRPDRFAAGEVVDAKVSTIDKAGRKVSLSIKAREVEEENRAMAEFGSSNSGASLGDILGAALKEKSAQAGDNDESERENTGDLLDAVTPKDAVEELVMNDTAKTDKTVNDKVVEKSKKVSTKKQKAVKKTASTKKKTAAKKKATAKKNSTPTSASDS